MPKLKSFPTSLASSLTVFIASMATSMKASIVTLNAAVMAAAFTAVAIVYVPFLGNPFLMDDELQVTGNSAIQNLSNWKTFFVSSTMDTGGTKSLGGIYFKPLMTLYYALVWNFAGPEPAAFRLPILLIHIASGLLIYLFLSRHFSKLYRFAAFAVALLFLLHPANVEVIAYIADAQDALYFFFGMLALNIAASCLAKDVAPAPTKFRWLQLFSIAICLMASVLSKETGFLFVLATVVYAWLNPVQSSESISESLSKSSPELPRRSAIFITGLSTLVCPLYAALRWSAGLTTYHHSTLLLHQASWATRLQTVPLIAWHYIEIFFFPWRISMVTDFVVNTPEIENFWLPLLGVLITFGGMIWFTKKKATRLTVFAFTCLVLWFGLHGNAILPLDGTYADRWLYFAFLPLSILSLQIIPSCWWNSRGMKVSVVLLSAAFMLRDHIRLKDWATPISLYRRESTLHPRDAVMTNNVGVELFKKGEIDSARGYFKSATEFNPMWEVGWNNLGATYQRSGDFIKARESYAKSVSLGVYSLAYENYAAITCAMEADPKLLASSSSAQSDSTFPSCRDFVSKALEIFPENARIQEIRRAIQH